MKNLLEPVKSLNIYPSSLRHVHCPPTWTGHEKNPDVNMFFYVLDGAFVLNIENNSYFVRKNQLAFLPKGKEHFFWLLPDRNMTMIDVDFKSERLNVDLFEYYGLTEDTHVVNIPQEKVMSIYNIANQPVSPSSQIPHHITLCSEIARLCGIYIESRIRKDETETEFATIIDFMRRNLDKDISLETLASLVHLEATYFSAKFKRATGISPIKYLNELRAMQASNLLRTTDKPISDIALSVGFNNKYRFNSFFFNAVGLLPDKYKKAFIIPPNLQK